MIAAKESLEPFKPKLFDDVAVLQRKWHAAPRPGTSLPCYEDVMLGSLGRLADHIALLKAGGVSIEVSRAGRYFQDWLGEDAWGVSLEALQSDCATALAEAIRCALQNRQPYLALAHCVRDGLVRTYDVLALPTASSWGGTLIGAYVNQRGSHQLRELGVRISMDDFGTGYSSLSYLRSFPFDKIKIDRSFVRDLAHRPDCVAIVRAISGLGRSLNITTTAEGVETIDQLDRLRAEGCNEVQGFLFGAAKPAAEIKQLLCRFGRRASQAA